ncbi:MAG: Lrp/AsnC family transcriptional regulator [Euryarchaeota archaeon]|nr:Lrp/AsnC family transcriptional regulator [Euryarchaeota archaeon]
MDALDAEIIEMLRRNAREPYVEIATRLKTSEGTIRARVKKLVADGSIRQFTLRTGGSTIKALVEVKVNANVPTDHVSRLIASWRGVENVWEVAGENDILVLIGVPATDSLNEIVERVRQMKEVSSTRSRLVLKEMTSVDGGA